MYLRAKDLDPPSTAPCSDHHLWTHLQPVHHQSGGVRNDLSRDTAANTPHSGASRSNYMYS